MAGVAESDRVVLPWKVLAGMQKVRRVNARNELKFAEAWKVYQTNADNKAKDNIKIVEVASTESFPRLIAGDIPAGLEVAIVDDVTGRAAFENILRAKTNVDDLYITEELRRWDAMQNVHHLSHETLTELGIPITGPEMFRFQSPQPAESVSSEVVAEIARDIEANLSSSDEEEEDKAIIVGKRRPPAAIPSASHKEQIVPPYLNDEIEALKNSIEESDLSEIPNDLQIDAYDTEIISGDPYRPKKCKLQNTYGWMASETSGVKTSFAGVNGEFLNLLSGSPEDIPKAIVFINRPKLLPLSDRTRVEKLLDGLKDRLSKPLLNRELKEGETLNDLISEYQELRFEKPSIEDSAQIALVYVTTYPENANLLQWQVAQFAASMMNSHQGHRVHGGDMYEEQDTFDSTSTEDGDELFQRMRKFRNETKSMWQKLRERPQAINTEQLQDVERDLEVVAEDTAESFSDKLRNAGEYLKNIGSKVSSGILSIGKRIKKETKRISELMEEHTPASTAEAQEHVRGIRNWLINAKHDLQAKTDLLENEEHAILADAEKNLDNFQHQVDRYLMATKVDDSTIQSVEQTSKILERQTMEIPDLETGNVIAVSRRQAVLHIHKMVNRLQWFFYNEGPEKYKSPYELSLFMSFLGNICQSSEVKEVSEFSTLKSEHVWFDVPGRSKDEQYRFYHDMLGKLDLLLQSSFTGNVPLGSVMRTEYENGLLTPEDIDDILSGMNYIGTLAMDPIRAQRTAGHATFHENNRSQVYDAAYTIYKDKLRFTPPTGKTVPCVSVRRLAQNLNVCSALLKVSQDEEHKKMLRDDQTYYLAIVYSNSAIVMQYMGRELQKLYGNRDLESSSDSFDSSGTDSTDTDVDSEEEEEHEVHRNFGAAKAAFCIEGQRTHSPCVSIGQRQTSLSYDKPSLPTHRAVALSHLSDYCSNWHDYSHALDNVGVRSHIFL